MTTTAHQTEIEVDPEVPILRTIREFDFPAAAVFRAHADPDVFTQWIGPPGSSAKFETFDFRTGGSIGYGRAFIRWIGRYVSAIACLLGYFWMLWDKEKQTWHDKFANDVVVPESAYPVQNWPG